MYLSESLEGAALAWAFFRFGCGMRHSIWKATQLVHGTPRFAASQRTCRSRCEHPHHKRNTKHEGRVDLRLQWAEGIRTLRAWHVWKR